MKSRKREEEHAHHERWLVSYADFMTLLFALFVVLFASSNHDRQSIQKVSSAVHNGFQEMGAFSGAAHSVTPDGTMGADGMTTAAPGTGSAEGEYLPAAQAGGVDAIALQQKLNQVLGKEIARQEVAMRMTPEGFVISLHELGFFDSGQAVLLPGAAEKIKRLATVLMQYGLDMRVEGHSDNIPIHNAQFNSNWELSTARATAVAMMLLQDASFDPRRMSIAGYGQYHPVGNNDTLEGRRSNRRVDIVIVAVAKPSLPPLPSPAPSPSPSRSLPAPGR